MLSNRQQKYIQSLAKKKFRDQYNAFIVEGDKIVKEVIQAGSLKVKGIYGSENWMEKNAANLDGSKAEIITVSPIQLKKISQLKTPNQVLAVIEKPSPIIDPEKLQKTFSFYLEQLQDPGNMGTIWRIADWFGWSYLLCSDNCVDVYNPKVIQSSMGAFLRIPVLHIPFDELKKAYPKLPKYAAYLNGENVYQTTFPDAGIIIIGNESKGISDDLMDHQPTRLTIPKGTEDGAESLNASVAAGIFAAMIERG